MTTSNCDAVKACALLGLGAAWAPVLAEHLGPADEDGHWAAHQVHVARRRLLTGFDEVGVADLRAIARAATWHRGAAGRRIPPRLQKVALTVALAAAGDDAGWRGSQGRTTRTLLARGLATKNDMDAATLVAFDALWVGGCSRTHIGAVLMLSNAAVERLAKQASPPRWGYRAVTRHLGWSPDDLRLRRNNGTFPEPDGTDRGKDWWWPNTIDSWADRAGLER
ncbi:hypothetical protein ASD62_02965 [Phycicoccus sp. Root563]|uniref:hypothetical protein n=1 Tax=Phycicoccus sp. Root563 TaxID=1736562 RepID=UPI0007032650|nr:hypothetical protein [Phycicoccus sp. Root563]KQZ88428.1 hypothetical protein ASD62_02965 [Phycicoccus sp. Root563]